MKLTFDFETRSTIELKTASPWKYAESPTTDVICLSVKIDDKPAGVWVPQWVSAILPVAYPTMGDRELKSLVLAADEYEAHNVEFERAIWHHIMVGRYGFPPLELDKCSCTAARAAAMSLPRPLAQVCEVLGLGEKKDDEGHRLMLKMCKPRKPVKKEVQELEANGYTVNALKQIFDCDGREIFLWHESPEQIMRLIDYCKQDVEAEYELSTVLRPLSIEEKRVWRLDQVINRRGVCVDTKLASDIASTLEGYEKGLLAKMRTLTGGEVDSPRKIAALQRWLATHGIVTDNLQKNTVLDLMKTDLPGDIRAVLECRQSLGKSSVSKFTAMLDRVQEDNRIRSLFMYHGAGTGRWAGKGVQVHNLPRDSYKGQTLDHVAKCFGARCTDSIQLFYGDPMVSASMCVRGSLIAAPGHDFICSDYSSIEARGNAWLAGDEPTLEAFREGKGIYELAASGIFGVPYEQVTKSQRQVGKVSELALGYGGGIGAYASMASGYGINLESMIDIILPLATAEELDSSRSLAETYIAKNPDVMTLEAAMACGIIKSRWRKAHPMIVKLWRGLGDAARNAVENPGEMFSYRSIAYKTWKDRRGNNYLLCRLPSGRCLYYFDPQMRPMKTPWGQTKSVITAYNVNSVTKQWVRRPLIDGTFDENTNQGMCRDFLAEAKIRLEAAGYPVVLHVHDEIASEVPECFGSQEEFDRIMSEVSIWAKGMPIEVKGWRGKRFKK